MTELSVFAAVAGMILCALGQGLYHEGVRPASTGSRAASRGRKLCPSGARSGRDSARERRSSEQPGRIRLRKVLGRTRRPDQADQDRPGRPGWRRRREGTGLESQQHQLPDLRRRCCFDSFGHAPKVVLRNCRRKHNAAQGGPCILPRDARDCNCYRRIPDSSVCTEELGSPLRGRCPLGRRRHDHGIRTNTHRWDPRRRPRSFLRT